MNAGFFILVSVGFIAGGNGKDEAADTEIKRFEGDWKLIALVHDGKGIEPGANVLKIRGDRITEKSNEDITRITVNPGKKLKEINLIGVEGRHKGETMPGVYIRDGDLLVICHAHLSDKGRPTDFACAPESGRRLLVFQRVRAGKD
ncbi:MAG: TIGR03067 domain-containing protein [Planctomycetes bacterium]|nr:TIGR03067 domain-containing protein [Planctomycetota bacterium]